MQKLLLLGSDSLRLGSFSVSVFKGSWKKLLIKACLETQNQKKIVFKEDFLWTSGILSPWVNFICQDGISAA